VTRAGDAHEMPVVIFLGIVGIDACVPLVFAQAQLRRDIAVVFEPHIEIALLPPQVARHIAAMKVRRP